MKAASSKISGLLALLVLALGATQLSCNVNDYCLNCGTGDAGGSGSGDGDAMDGGGSDDAPPDAACVPTGPEICDDIDNDCNGLKDDGAVEDVGDPCEVLFGACAGGVKECVSGVLRCDRRPSPEVCDFVDNNCNGTTDEGDPGGGGICGTNAGECQAGTLRCQSAQGCDPAANCDPLVSNNCCIKCANFIDHRGDDEECNAKDDDCDTMFDEGLSNLGPCTWQGATDVGACEVGVLECQGGNPVCEGAVFPKFETCNSVDDNCNNMIDEVFDTDTDINNCGTCMNVCPIRSKTCAGGTNARMTCTTDTNCPGSTCVVNSQPCCGDGCLPSRPTQADGTCNFECNVGFIDLNGTAADGCEYKCSPTGVTEECDGIDNNCNGTIDENLTAPTGLCLTQGVCSGTAPTCMGAQGWRCNYGTSAEFPEVSCDNLNNDCDANIDESHPLKYQTCYDNEPASPPDQGACRDQGVYQCNAADPDGTVVCMRGENGAQCTNNTDDNGDGRVNEGCPQVGAQAETGAQCTDAVNSDTDGDNRINDGCPAQVLPDTMPATESCNAKDDDCDGSFDETTAGNLAGVEWVLLGNGKQMMKYEASKPDATTADQGITTTVTNGGVTRTQVCSRPGVQPWTNISYPQAQAACAAVGASLCTETQWHAACSAVALPALPYTASTAATAFFEAENYTGISHAVAPAVAESGTNCSNATDDDTDSRINDGCPVQGAGPSAGPEALSLCFNSADDDGDGFVNDGCPVVEATTRAWIHDYTSGYSGISAMEASPNTLGGSVTVGNELTQSPRLDYSINVAAGSYHVQVKMFQTGFQAAGTFFNGRIFVGMSPHSASRVAVTMPVAAACTTNANCTTAGYTNGVCVDSTGDNVVDACSGWRWVDAATFNTVAASTQTVSIWMGDDGVKVDKIALTQTATAPVDSVAGPGNIWAFATSANTYATMTCNGQDFSAANDNVLATGSLASCFADNANGDVFDMSGNVKEWTVAQSPGQNPIRGGASNSTGTGISCPLNFTVADDEFLFPNIGFRCCK